MTPSVLIIGAGIYQEPAIVKAKELGFRTVVVDRNPTLKGMLLADKAVPLDTTAINMLIRLAREEKVSAVFSMGSDLGIRSVSIITQKLRLPGPSTQLINHSSCDKQGMMSQLVRHRIPVVRQFKTLTCSGPERRVDEILYPCIIKPVDGWGSRGVSLVRKKIELIPAIDRAKKFSAQKLCVIEEFLEGVQVTAEMFWLKGDPVFIGLTEKQLSPPPLRIPVSHTMPLVASRSQLRMIHEVTIQACRVMGVRQGPVDVDLVLTHNGPRILEMTPRLGGNCVPLLVELAYGFDIVKASIQLSAGRKPSISTNSARSATVKIFFSDKKRRLVFAQLLHKLRNIKGLSELRFDIENGMVVRSAKTSSDRFGHALAISPTYQEVTRALKTIIAKMKEAGIILI